MIETIEKNKEADRKKGLTASRQIGTVQPTRSIMRGRDIRTAMSNIRKINGSSMMQERHIIG